MRWPIGYFSRLTGFSIKTLRHYDAIGLLPPATVDSDSRYRYYDESSLERARAIAALRALEFPLSDIGDLLDGDSGGGELLELLVAQHERISARLAALEISRDRLDRAIAAERNLRERLASGSDAIRFIEVPEMSVATIRFTGRYDEVGQSLGIIGRSCGEVIAGPAFSLYYQAEYREDDADIETGFPIRESIDVSRVTLRTLPAATVLALVHHGPYDTLGHSYERLLRQVETEGLGLQLPIREVYLKGPGSPLARGGERFVTEIQIPIG